MSVKEAKRALRKHIKQMRLDGVPVTSPFNGGMSREVQRRNEQRFALKNAVDLATKAEAPK
jgi:hypothetical protein